jgi:hypothetical protein
MLSTALNRPTPTKAWRQSASAVDKGDRGPWRSQRWPAAGREAAGFAAEGLAAAIELPRVPFSNVILHAKSAA